MRLMPDLFPGIRIGGSDDYVELRVEDGILHAEAVGSATGAEARRALAEGLQQGWLRLSMPTLVDMTRFTGSIDWGAMRDIAAMAPWGQPGDAPASPPSRVAYVTRDSLFSLILKLMAAIFPHARHRAFPDRDGALRWLRQPRPATAGRQPVMAAAPPEA